MLMTKCSKIVIVLILLSGSAGFLKAESFRFDFKQDDGDILLLGYGEGKGPLIEDGSLTLVNGGWGYNHRNLAILPVADTGLYRIIELEFQFHITPGAEGFGIYFPEKGISRSDSLNSCLKDYHQPDLDKSFTIGFDIYDPPTSHWFDERGNFYNRPQREISLHWNNQEKVKILSPVEFRSDPAEEDEMLNCQVRIEYQTGGAMISLRLDANPVWEDFFIAGMQPYESGLAFGAQTSDLTCSLYLDNIKLEYRERISQPEPPLILKAIQGQPIFIDTRDTSHEVKLPDSNGRFGRIIMILELSEMPGGYDPWDKGAALYVWDDSTRYEICRFITPYGRGYTWQVDVSDFKPVLTGLRKLDLHVDTWMKKEEDPALQKGWIADVEFHFYEGHSNRESEEIVNVWNGFWEYGNPENPLRSRLGRKNVICPDEVSSARLRVLVTGHGMHPNSLNAAEFMPAGRTVFVNGTSYENILWKTDCYLNPCRPQGGTWKFDRAGWAPGSIVEPWVIDLKEVIPGDTIKLDYLPQAYLNTSEGDHYRAHHWIESQVIFYRE